jgi:hypothetical protein
MSEFKVSPEAAAALADFFGYMQKSKMGPFSTDEQIFDRANEQAVACTAFVRFLLEAYGPETAAEIAGYVAAMTVDLTGEEEAYEAGAEVASMKLEEFFADTDPDMALPEVEEFKAVATKDLN